MAVVAGYSGNASRPPAAAAAAPDAVAAPSNVQKSDGRTARLDARAPEIEAETQRLADVVRVLTADRDQLVARVGTLERNLEDITGAIKRQDARQEPRQELRPDPRQEMRQEARQDPTAGAVAPPAPPSGPPATATPVRPQPSAPERIANATEETSQVSEATNGEFGIDIGGAANFEGLRTLWAATKANNGAQLDGLHPTVAVRENSRAKNAELRLIVGPLADVEAAVRLCAALSGPRRYCQPVAFEGQRLADADTAPEHKPAAASKPAPKPLPKPAAKPPLKPSAITKFPRLF
jgi:hypothetical protein